MVMSSRQYEVEGLLPDAASLRGHAYNPSLDLTLLDLPRDEREGDHAVNYTADSSEEECSLPKEAQGVTPLSTEACHQAIDEAYATLVQKASTVATAAVSDNGKGKQEAEGQQAVMEVSTAPVLNPSLALRQTDIMSLVDHKDFRLKVPNFNHDRQRSGVEEEYTHDYGDTLAGYTSPGGSIRVHKEMMRLVFYAVAA
jgi:hypothetical protein